MPRLVIFGNSGSGKSTLARRLAALHALAHLDLDTLAWQPTQPPQPPSRRPIAESIRQVETFMQAHGDWVIEGCYADLLEPTLPQCSELVFLDLGTAACIANAKARPWEPHKYASKEAQDANLAMLLDWIAQYETRRDVLSLQAHRALFERFTGRKHALTSREANAAFEPVR